jgi:galactose-1-phosphate uridylyltransferase (family 1)
MISALSKRSKQSTRLRIKMGVSVLAVSSPKLCSLYLPGLATRLLRAEPVTGKCYVVTFSPSHNLTLADLSPSQILSVIETWTSIYTAHLSPTSPLAKGAESTNVPPSDPHANALKPKEQYRYMQIFENKGAAMGCSNPHPHGQIWTTTGLPEEPAAELEQLKKYRREQGGAHLLEEYAILESTKQERVVFENADFLALCPWWAVWPFEVMIVSKMHKRALVDFNDKERLSLAEAIAEVTRRYDNLFETHFPYSTSSIFDARAYFCEMLIAFRYGSSSGTTRWQQGGDRGELLPHAFLPPSLAQRHCEKVPRWVSFSRVFRSLGVV